MLRKVASNWTLLGLTLLATLLLLPVNLHQLGAKSYGQWLVIAALTGYLMLLQLGLPLAVVRTFSVAKAAADTEHMQRIVSTHFATNIGIGLVALLLAPLFLVSFEAGFHDDAALLADARIALLLAVVSIALTIVSQLPHAILSAYQEFVRLNAINAVVLAVKVVFNLVAIRLYPSLITLALVPVIGAVMELVGYTALATRVHKDHRISLSLFSRSELASALKIGLYAFLLSAGIQLVFQTSTLIIGSRLGTEPVAHYTIPIGLILQFMALIIGIAQVVMPVATELDATGRRAELVGVLYRWTKIAVAINCLAIAGLVVLGPDLIRVWLGPSMLPAATVLQIAIVSMALFLPVRGVALPILMGLGKMARPTVAIFIAGVASSLLALAAVDTFKVEGVAIANGVVMFALAFVIAAMACRELGVSTLGYLAETALKPAIGLAVVVAGGLLLKSAYTPRSYIDIAVSGSAITALFAAVWYLFVLRGDRHIELPRLAQVGRLLGRSAA